jgi:hypothetical protein
MRVERQAYRIVHALPLSKMRWLYRPQDRGNRETINRSLPPMSDPSPTPKYLRATMPDGSRWDVPVDVIAANRASRYASEFDADINRSLK